jgi:hypothetical protein
MNLNDCGCCEGTARDTPAVIDNRPGLSAIAYRTGTHATFRGTLLARLSAADRSLVGLTTRDDDDFSIALIDAWSSVADVLTFYQERIANEAYLRTATERLSVLELARLIDYQLRPGVAASTYLAFTVDDAPGALGQALSIGTTAQGSVESLPPLIIAAGVKVQSVPAPGEQAQTFETVEAIKAAPEWNAIAPRLTQPQPISESMETVVFDGLATNLKPGDVFLVVDSAGSRALKVAARVRLDEELEITRVDTANAGPLPAEQRPNLPDGTINDFPSRVPLDDVAISKIVGRKWAAADLRAVATMQGWTLAALTRALDERTAAKPAAGSAGVFAFRLRAAVFGHNAPRWESLPAAMRISHRAEKYKLVDGAPVFDKYEFVAAAFPTSWETGTLATISADDGAPQPSVTLDSSYPAIVKNSYITLVGPVQRAVVKVTDNVETTKNAFAISGKVSRLVVEPTAPLANFSMRNTAVLAQSEALALANLPILDAIEPGTPVTLDGAYLDLDEKQIVVLTGERADLPGVRASELLRLARVDVEAGRTVLTFERPLAYSYVRRTVTINANVAAATHGDTLPEEVLGSGNGDQAFQRFTLKQPPLTYVSAPTASGAESTLEVRVDDQLWHEVRSFFGRGGDERIYVTRTSDEGGTTVVFGDGRSGARVPTGLENVRARYRKGIGLGGLVRADQLTQLAIKPNGVKGVTNPLPAIGAADRERLDEARLNAPLTILTLDRVVSLRDYEDFARAFSGIGKALATWSWFGERRGVFLTVAGAGGAEVVEGSDLHVHLIDAIRRAGDPRVPLLVKSYQPRFFRIAAAVRIEPDALAEKVLGAIEGKLRQTFSFESRAFGQPVHLSEVIAAIQSIPGVIAVDVNALHRSDAAVTREEHLPAAVPLPGSAGPAPAEMLTLDARPVTLEVVQ